MYYIKIDTIIGTLTILEKNKLIDKILFPNEKKYTIEDYIEKETPLLKETKRQLDLYFKGKLKEFNLPLNIESTPFNTKVYYELMKIPYGETRTYKEIACNVGSEKACRAVGNANNKNKIPIIIPCHRVIGANNKLVGFGGGLDIKEVLLNLEKNSL